MKNMGIGGEARRISLNNHSVTVIVPRKDASYEEGVERIDRLIEKVRTAS